MASSLPEDTAICPEMNPVISALLAKLVLNSPLLPGWHEHCPVFSGPGGCRVRRRHGKPGKSSATEVARPLVYEPGYEAGKVVEKAAAMGRGPHLGSAFSCTPSPDLV